VVAAADRLRAELGADAANGWGRVARRKAAAGERLQTMERYAGTRRCRRRLLLGYFGEEPASCAGCDRCAVHGGLGRRGVGSWFRVF
jgi:superfamily II DNA helicase RecQ